MANEPQNNEKSARNDLVSIRSDDLRSSAAFAPRRGGLGVSLILPVNGKPTELLYIRDRYWERDEDTGGLPFLFPVCGRHEVGNEKNRYIFNGESYPMPLHGFGMRKPWAVAALTPTSITMTLSDDEETMAMYPFQFSVELTFAIANGRLDCRQRYSNRSVHPMPIYAGFHPYFLIQHGEWIIEGDFQKRGEYAPSYTSISKWEETGREINVLESAKNQHVFSLPPNWCVSLKRDYFPILKLESNRHGPGLRFKYLQLFRSGDDPFVCLEPWMGLPNGLNHMECVEWIPPGDSKTSELAIISPDLILT